MDIWELANNAFRRELEEAINLWESIKEFISDIEYDNPLHPALKQMTKQLARLKSQVLMNKPIRVYARSSC